MMRNRPLRPWPRLVTTLAFVLLPLWVRAQPAVYQFDPEGNLASVSATAAQPPSLVTAPGPQVIPANGLATFSVVAAGSGLTYQWLSNGVAIAGATNDSLVLGNLVLSGTNLGNFSVVVSGTGGSVTSAPAALWPDSNHNGIPDWWELAHFGNLNQPAGGDFDNDGVDNFHEYLEGTDPANPSSFNPRLSVETFHGSVSITPFQPYYSIGQVVSLTALADPGHQFSSWSGAISGTKPQINVVMDTNKIVLATFGYALATALDSPKLLWLTGGNASWFGQAEVSQDGVAAAQSGPIVSYWDGSSFVGEQTWLETISDVPVSSQLSFWWSVSSRPPAGLTFAIDAVPVASISGEAVGWQNLQTNVPPGRHTLTWTYAKGPIDIPTGVPYTDAGWVDQVSLVPSNSSGQGPSLNIWFSPTNTVVISWPAPSTGFTLQQTAELSPATWIAVPNSVFVVAGQNQVVIPPSATAQFYRLGN